MKNVFIALALLSVFSVQAGEMVCMKNDREVSATGNDEIEIKEVCENKGGTIIRRASPVEKAIETAVETQAAPASAPATSGGGGW